MKAIHLLLCLLFLTACATQPGKPGTPLPPQNKAVGEKWAPEVRQFIDALLTEFQSGKPAPTVEDIEQTFGVKAVAKTPGEYKVPGVENEYELRDWALKDPTIPSWSASYRTSPAKKGTQYQNIKFSIDSQQYCINPYDFAIYAGASTGATPDGSSHNPLARNDGSYALVYAWGMFERSPYGMYVFADGKGGGLLHLTDDRRCIDTFEKHARFIVNTDQ